ncbi:MAG: hypothetical protein QOC92_289 [Acidimicrobiaceae bacterium]|jgi:DNA-binding IclR family transcriptional regulator
MGVASVSAAARTAPVVERPAAIEPTGVDTSVGKALAILDELGTAKSLGVSALARRTELPKSTVFRLLARLEERGYVERLGKEYCLGRRLFELGNQIAACRPSGLRDIALPYLTELYERTHYIVHLAILDGVEVLYLEKLFGRDPTRAPSHVGRRVPAACCGLGKAMLAFSDQALVTEVLGEGLKRHTPYTIAVEQLFLEELARIRDAGVAFDREEVAVGLTCVAAPILIDGRAVAAVSVSGPTARFDPETMVNPVRRAAAAIAQHLQA